MPTGRAVLLLRRLSTGDNRFKNINLNQNNKDPLSIPVCCHRDLGLTKRYLRTGEVARVMGSRWVREARDRSLWRSLEEAYVQQWISFGFWLMKLTTFGPNNLAIPPLVRSFSDNIIKMTSHSSEAEKEPKYTNSLITEKSPYLLQHAHNPVNWYPWGQKAIEKAKKENKLIFLSIGYSTCHWCHVMEKETFENEEIADIMNTHFVNIKVDREERPDIDRVYMLFVMATTHSGGWPLSVFLTPDLRPVTGGTYFPPEDRWGRPGFKTVLLSLAKRWKNDRGDFVEATHDIWKTLQRASKIGTEFSPIPGEATWNRCVRTYCARYEPEFGGFGTAPKFPQASIFNFLFHYYARDKSHPEGKKCLNMCLHTLTKIANGGIHDHIAGGFSRYSVDNDWHVPHFEKMLYDQAQLTVAYTDAYLATKDEFYAEIVRDIIKYANKYLRHPSGGFYTAEDADSYPTYGAPHKKEGAFYVWEYEELEALLKDKKLNSVSYLDVFCDYFSVEKDGNISPDSDPHGELTDKNVLIIYGSKEKTASTFDLSLEQFNKVISECIGILHEARQKRPPPHLDSKMVCSWNGLMMAALAQAGQGLGEKDYVEDAIATAQFIKDHLYNPSTKTLLHCCYRADDGSISQIENIIDGFLDDYAFLIKGLLDLYEASLDTSWLQWARELQHKQDQLFWDPDTGGYFTSNGIDETVLLRLMEDQDGAEPSGNSVSCHNLLRLAAYNDKGALPTGGIQERDRAKQLLWTFAKHLNDLPNSLPEMMSALMFYSDSPTQVLISGGRSDPRTLELVRVVRTRLLPGRVLAVADPTAESPAGMSDLLLSRVRTAGDVPTAYVCRRYACSLPVTDVKQLENLLDETPILVPKSK